MCRRFFLLPFKILFVFVVIIVLGWMFKDIIIERVAARALSSSLGQADAYDFRIANTSAFDLLRGRVREAYLTARGLKPKKGPDIDFLQVRMKNIGFDSRQIETVGEALFTANILEDDLRTYVKSAAPEGYDPDIAIVKDGLTVTLKKNLLGLHVPVKLSGRLTVEKKHLLVFSPRKASMASVSIPAGLLDGFFKKMNPLLDTMKLKHPLELDSLDLDEGSLTLKGKVFMKLPIVFRPADR